MKKYLMIPTFALVGFMMPATASASYAECESASKEAAFYQSKAAGAWSAYGGCKGFEWMGGKTKSHCEKIHHQAESWQNTANRLHKEALKACAK